MPMRQDLFSQANRAIWHPQPEMRALHIWPLNGSPQARALSMSLKPPRPFTIPTWDLPTVLRTLKGPPFELLQSVNLRSLSLKTTLILALASVKWMSDLQALSESPYCPQFGPHDSKVILKPKHGYVPQALSTLRFLPQMKTRS